MFDDGVGYCFGFVFGLIYVVVFVEVGLILLGYFVVVSWYEYGVFNVLYGYVICVLVGLVFIVVVGVVCVGFLVEWVVGEGS